MTASSCEACNTAEQNPLSGLYYTKCKDCSVRHLSRSLSYWKAKQAGKMLPEYKQALEAVFGSEWQEWHKMVKNVETTYGQTTKGITK